MNIFAVALKYLRGRLVTSALDGLLGRAGGGPGALDCAPDAGHREGFIQGTTDFNLMVGAKGSPTQLVFNVIFRIDVPPPNISYTVYEQLHDEPRVEVAVPVMLGDAYQGFRYVATTPNIFALSRGAVRRLRWLQANSFTMTRPTNPPMRRC